MALSNLRIQAVMPTLRALLPAVSGKFQRLIVFEWPHFKSHRSMVGLSLQNAGMIGTLTRNTEYVPSPREGCLVYLNVDGEPRDQVLAGAAAASAQILLPISPIDPQRPRARVAWILDSEGSRIGRHSNHAARVDDVG
ncbi:MAG: hypothetical protein ACU843_00935 [Gammaproteobacteria bacterium]